MIERYLWIVGSLPFIFLGTIHLLYTFFSNKFSSRTVSVEEGMKFSYPVLTKQTTMWKAWIGFNASHSSGVIYIGLLNLFAGIWYPVFVHNPIFLSLNIGFIFFYLWLAKKFWFKIPFMGVFISSCCFTAAAIIALLG